MKANRLNQSFIDAMQVLRQAKTDGKKITISGEKNEIHAQTFFEKILYSSTKKSTVFKDKNNEQINRNLNCAKNHVAQILKREIKSSILIFEKEDGKKNPALDGEIDNLSINFVEKLLSKENSENLINDFQELILAIGKAGNIKLTDENKKNITKGLSHVKEINTFAFNEKNKFKFIKVQLNERLDQLEKLKKEGVPDETSLADSKTMPETDLANLSDIADRAVWVQKNKWMSGKRALGWAVGMNQPELRGLSNKQRFDISWKVVTSAGAGVKKIEPAVWKEDFKKLARERTEKNIHNYLKSASKNWIAFDFDVKQLTRDLMHDDYAGFNPAERFAIHNQIKTTPTDRDTILKTWLVARDHAEK